MKNKKKKKNVYEIIEGNPEKKIFYLNFLVHSFLTHLPSVP